MMNLVKRDNACGYHARSKAIGTDVIVGGKNIAADKFVPGVNMSFHPTAAHPDGEFFIDLNHIDSPMTDRNDILANGKVTHEGGGFKHEFYPDGTDRIKWDMLFDSPAVTPDTIRFRIKASKELSFTKQILTAEQIVDGDEYVVPEAEGSYAVYIDGKRNNKYQTGKVAHIYSPFYVDENGDRSPLLTMDITPDGDNAKMLILTDTQAVTDWKNDPIRAGHKLRMDPILGYDTLGSLLTDGFGSSRTHSVTTDSSGGELSTIYAYFSKATNDSVKLGITNLDQLTGNPTGKPLVAQVEIIGLTIAEGVPTKISSAIAGSLLPLTKYAFAWISGSGLPKISFDNLSATSFWIWSKVAYGDELQDPMPNCTNFITDVPNYSLWVEYEAIGGLSKSGQAIPPGVKKSFGLGGSQFNKPPGMKGVFR